MARLIEDTLGAGLETIRILVTNNLFTAALGTEIRKEGGATRALKALQREFFPEEAKPAEPAPVPTTYTAQVAYGITPGYDDLKQTFDWVWDGWRGVSFDRIDACKDVPFENEVKDVTFEIVHLAKYASTDAVLAELDRQGLRPAVHEELLGFAKKYPELQRQFPTVALGSVALIDSRRRVAYVHRHGSSRGLGMYIIGRDWSGFYRFLAVCK